MMQKENGETFSDNEKMSLGRTFEQVVAKSLTSKNKLRKLFSGFSLSGYKDSRNQQPFQKAPLFRARGNRSRGIPISLICWDTEKRKKYFLTQPISAYPNSCPWEIFKGYTH